MQLKDIDLLYRRQPFRPFRAKLSTGESFDVLHPEMLIIAERFVVIGRKGDGAGEELTVYWIDPAHIVHVHRLEGPK
jgi:hypothetical protein